MTQGEVFFFFLTHVFLKHIITEKEVDNVKTITIYNHRFNGYRFYS